MVHTYWQQTNKHCGYTSNGDNNSKKKASIQLGTFLFACDRGWEEGKSPQTAVYVVYAELYSPTAVETIVSQGNKKN